MFGEPLEQSQESRDHSFGLSCGAPGHLLYHSGLISPPDKKEVRGSLSLVFQSFIILLFPPPIPTPTSEDHPRKDSAHQAA